MSRKTNRAGRRRPETTYDQAIAELPAAEAKMLRESDVYQSAYSECVSTLHRLHGVMARERGKMIAARRRVDTLRSVIDAGDGAKQVIAHKLIDNPMITQGLLDAVAEGEVETQHEASQMAAINQVLLVGGLAKVANKSEWQFMAAARYCHLYERSQIGAAQAMDYAKLRVDTSGPSQDQISQAQDDARRDYDAASKALGKARASMVEMVVVYGNSMRALAKSLGYGEGGQARKRAEKALLDALDVLVDHFGLKPSDAGKARFWSDGGKAIIVRDPDRSIAQ